VTPSPASGGRAGGASVIGTLQDLLCDLKRFGDAPALIAFTADGREKIGFETLTARSLALAGGLMARGLRPGTPVALFAPNSIEWVVCRLALIAADALCMPLDFDADETRVRDLMRDSGARLIFTVDPLLPVVDAACGALDLQPEIVLLRAPASAGRALPVLDDLAGAPPASLPQADDEAPVSQFYTSGSTGPPKAVPLTHRNIVTNIRVLRDLAVLSPGDRVLLPLPLHHSYPFIVGLMLPLAAGCTVVLPAGVTGPNLVRALREGKVTVMVGVPRLYEAMVDAIERRLTGLGPIVAAAARAVLRLSGALRRYCGSRLGGWLLAPLRRQFAPHLRTLVSGGAHLKAETGWRLEALGFEVLCGYGLVETTSVATFNAPGAARIGSAGRPSPAVEMRIVPMPGLEHGEIQFRGPVVFGGYRGNPAATAEAFTADGWFRTGDLGWQDADGYLFVAGRSKEVIVLPDGKNVAPEEVEAAYARSRYVREIAVLERNGRLVALVLPDLDAARTAGTGRLANELRVAFGELGSALPRYMRIADFVTVREPLPRNPLGKYLRHRLPDLFDRAERGETPVPHVPSEEDRARLATPRARAVLGWLGARFPGKRLDLDTSLQMELDIDSLSWVDLSLDLERRVGVRLSEDAIAGLVTVRDLIAAAEAAGAPAAGAPHEAPMRDAERWLGEPGPVARLAGSALRVLARIIARLYFRLEVAGRAELPADGPLVIVANHASDLDPVVLAAALPHAVLRRAWWGADARRVFGHWLGRLVARPMRLFPIDDHAPGASLDLACAVLARGRALIWFPEEWRSPTGELQPFQSGVGALVARTGATILPVHIAGTFEAMPRSARLPRPHRVCVRIGRLVPAAQLTRDAPAADERARHRLIAARIRDVVAALGGTASGA